MADEEFEEGAPLSQLLVAAFEGDIDAVRAAVEAGDPLEDADADGTTALLAAAFHGFVDIVQYLLAQGANSAHRSTAHGWDALICAASQGHDDCVEVLLTHGVKPKTCESWCSCGQRARARTGLHVHATRTLLPLPALLQSTTTASGRWTTRRRAISRARLSC